MFIYGGMNGKIEMTKTWDGIKLHCCVTCFFTCMQYIHVYVTLKNMSFVNKWNFYGYKFYQKPEI